LVGLESQLCRWQLCLASSRWPPGSRLWLRRRSRRLLRGLHFFCVQWCAAPYRGGALAPMVGRWPSIDRCVVRLFSASPVNRSLRISGGSVSIVCLASTVPLSAGSRLVAFIVSSPATARPLFAQLGRDSTAASFYSVAMYLRRWLRRRCPRFHWQTELLIVIPPRWSKVLKEGEFANSSRS
jgi:hypothetical protein